MSPEQIEELRNLFYAASALCWLFLLLGALLILWPPANRAKSRPQIMSDTDRKWHLAFSKTLYGPWRFFRRYWWRSFIGFRYEPAERHWSAARASLEMQGLWRSYHIGKTRTWIGPAFKPGMGHNIPRLSEDERVEFRNPILGTPYRRPGSNPPPPASGRPVLKTKNEYWIGPKSFIDTAKEHKVENLYQARGLVAGFGAAFPGLSDPWTLWADRMLQIFRDRQAADYHRYRAMQSISAWFAEIAEWKRFAAELEVAMTEPPKFDGPITKWKISPQYEHIMKRFKEQQ